MSEKGGTRRGAPASSRRQTERIEVEAVVEAPSVRIVPAAFEDFYRTMYVDMARALSLALGDRALGTEAADEAFARAYERWVMVRGYRNPAGWVYRVGLNWARSFLRKRRREVIGIYADPGEEMVSGADPGVDRALGQLSEKHRAVVVMKYYLDWTIEDMAEALGVPRGTVKSRLHRALGQLEAALKGAS